MGGVDGLGLGLIPSLGTPPINDTPVPGGYGAGGSGSAGGGARGGGNGGLGGGAGAAGIALGAQGGPGGGNSGAIPAGSVVINHGIVGVEVLG